MAYTCVQYIGGLTYATFAYVQSFYRKSGLHWLIVVGSTVCRLVFSSIAGRLAEAGLCSVVLQDAWPRIACVL